MIARVVTRRDDARLALAISITVGLALAAVVLDDVLHMRLVGSPDVGTYSFVALLFALGGIAPWAAWTQRGRATEVRCHAGSITLGGRRIVASDVTSFSIVDGARGSSVAIGRPKKLTFLEVERREDAARIAAALDVPCVPFGAPRWKSPSRWLAFPQAWLAVLAVVVAPFYFAAATGELSSHAFWPTDSKALFGIIGVVLAELSMVLLVTRRLLSGHAVAVRRGIWDEHVRLHRTINRAAEASAPAGGPVDSAFSLGRGDELVGAWLARIDAMPTEQHAYRGDALKKDVLWQTLGDDGAPVDVRMAAARVLRRRYQEHAALLVRVVDDPEVRVRVEAAFDDQEEAERQIEALGPLFRAR